MPIYTTHTRDRASVGFRMQSGSSGTKAPVILRDGYIHMSIDLHFYISIHPTYHSHSSMDNTATWKNQIAFMSV